MRNLAWALVAVSVAACGEGPYCDRAGAEAALMAAAPGDTVELGACEIQGPLRVPPGVTLAGTTGTVVVAPVESGGIVGLGGTSPTVVRDLRVVVQGRIGILFRGGGAARVSGVTIEARHGIALGASELASLELSNVSLEGPVTADTASDPRWVRVLPAPVEPAECPGCDCTPGMLDEDGERVCDAAGQWATWTATYGLVLTRVAAATLTDVDARGFAAWGALLTDSGVTWDGGGVHDTLGIGVRQVGGALAMTDVVAERTVGGLRGDRPYAIHATDGARVEGTRVTVSDNERYGVLLAGASGRLVDLVAEGNGDAALWVSETEDFELSGTGTQLVDNDFAGAVIVASSGVRIADGAIDGTREAERPLGMIGLLRVGDGVQIAETRGPITLADLALAGNDRAGLLVDLGASGGGDVTFANVAVDASGTALGAVAGRPAATGALTVDAPAGWDTGITRNPAASSNDPAFTGTISVVPEHVPSPIFDPGEVLRVVAPMF
ncbi:MAG: right-handed parallel beta-helix repeat-containing protein [Myxococcales bacterium]|nr:right-handed parallel beta-helix repeat-containing protein [Myxococcales bacterium]